MRHLFSVILVITAVAIPGPIAFAIEMLPPVTLRELILEMPPGRFLFSGRTIAFDGQTLWTGGNTIPGGDSLFYQHDVSGRLIQVLNSFALGMGPTVNAITANLTNDHLYIWGNISQSPGPVFDFNPATRAVSQLFGFLFRLVSEKCHGSGRAAQQW
jgi:hypothetical protein